MANTLRIKRRITGAPGAPGALKNAELAYNEVDNVLYYGKGDAGDGTATSIIQIAGSGVFATKSYVDTAIANADLSSYAKLGASNTFATGFTNTFNGTTNLVGAFQLGGSAVTSTAAELNLLDGALANTVVNSKAVIYGSAGQIRADSMTAGDILTDYLNVTADGIDTTSLRVGSGVIIGDTSLAFIDLDTGMQRFHIDGFTGNTTIDGTLSVAGGNFTVAANGNISHSGTLETGTVNATTVSAYSGLSVGAGAFVVDGSGNVATSGSGTFGTLSVGSGNFTVAGDGTVSTSGNLSAAAGNFTVDGFGGVAATGGLSAAEGAFTVDASGNVTAAGSVTFGGALSAAGGTFNVDGSGISTEGGFISGGGAFEVDGEGNVYSAGNINADGMLASNGTLLGFFNDNSGGGYYTLNANDAGVVVGDNAITLSNTGNVSTTGTGTFGSVLVDSAGAISTGDGTNTYPLTQMSTSGFSIYWGSETYFYVGASGNLSAARGAFTVDTDGNVATNGTLSAARGAFDVDVSGNVETSGTGTFDGGLIVGGGAFTVDGGGAIANDGFNVDASGNVETLGTLSVLGGAFTITPTSSTAVATLNLTNVLSASIFGLTLNLDSGGFSVDANGNGMFTGALSAVNSAFVVNPSGDVSTTGTLSAAGGTFTVAMGGHVTAGRYNNVTITAPASPATFTLASAKTFTVSNTLTFTGTDASSVNFGAGGTVSYTGAGLNQFAETTSAQLAGIISDETGSGLLVFGTSPQFTTSVTTDSTSFSVFNTNATTVNAFGAATTLNLGYTGAAASTTNIATGVNLFTTKNLNLGTGATTGTTNVDIGSFNGSTTIRSNNVSIREGGMGTINICNNLANTTTTTVNICTNATGITAATVNIGTGSTSTSATTNINIGSATGTCTTTIHKDLVVNGNLTINGTTTTLNTNTLSVDDKEIELGAVAAVTGVLGIATAGSAVITGLSRTANIIPGSAVSFTSGNGTVTMPAGTTVASVDSATQVTLSAALTGTGPVAPAAVMSFGGATDTTAAGGGIRLKGTTDKTINWTSANGWTSSEDFNVASGKVYRVAGTTALSATALGSGVVSSSLTSVGTITSGTWNGTPIGLAYGGTGATTPEEARINLGLGTIATQNANNVAITGGTIDNIVLDGGAF
jgi:hypothetical protein